MELFQGDRYTRQLLRRHRRLRRDFWGLVLLQLLFWLTEGTAAVLLLRLLERPAGALLTESVLVWRLVQGVWYAVSLPLSVWCRWTVRLRVTQCSGMGGNGLHVGGRAVFLSLLCTLLRTAALLPAALFLSGAYHLARMGTAHAESAPWLFGSMQCVVAAVVCLLLWGYLCLGLLCVPYVWFAAPDMPCRRVLSTALRIMHGNRKALLGTAAWYAAAMLPVVTIPHMLPRAGTALICFFNIRVRLFFQNRSSQEMEVISRAAAPCLPRGGDRPQHDAGTVSPPIPKRVPPDAGAAQADSRRHLLQRRSRPHR